MFFFDNIHKKQHDRALTTQLSHLETTKKQMKSMRHQCILKYKQLRQAGVIGRRATWLNDKYEYAGTASRAKLIMLSWYQVVCNLVPRQHRLP